MDYNAIFIATIFVGFIILLYFTKIKDEDIVLIEKDEQNANQQEIQNKKEEEEQKVEKTFLGIDVLTWGWISVITNGVSVFVQMSNLIATQCAQSFSMYFIFLMTLLNAIYCLVGILTYNWGLAIATFLFVIYNLSVVYFYYYGKKR